MKLWAWIKSLAKGRKVAIYCSDIHRTLLDKGLAQFTEHVEKNNRGNLKGPRETTGGKLVSRSAVGLVLTYNMLPDKFKTNWGVK